MNHFLRILFFLCVVKPFLTIVLGINVFGRGNLPRQGQFIVVANHNSHLDTLALMNLFPLGQLHRIHPVVAADYFMSNPLLAWFSTTLINIIPIPRKGFTKTNNPLTRMGEILERGDSLIIFPEGTRGEPEMMSAFQTGVAHLIQKYPQIPVIPMLLQGMGRSLPKGEFILVPFFCDLIVGLPRHYEGDKHQICHQLEQDILTLKAQLESEVGNASVEINSR